MNNGVIEILKKTGALIKGHFLLSSGKHSSHYVQCAKLLMHPEWNEFVCKEIIKKLGDIDVDIVVGPAMGGIIISYELARGLGVPAIFCEREDEIMTFRRGFHIKKGSKVLVVEDVVTTGKSSLEAINLIEESGGNVLGVCCLVDRTAINLDIGYKIYSATKLEIDIFDKNNCPNCINGDTPVKPGSRKVF